MLRLKTQWQSALVLLRLLVQNSVKFFTSAFSSFKSAFMPLITGTKFVNRFGGEMRAAPNPATAGNLAPAQGDHIFGDVLGTVETALQSIFGGGAVWVNRMGTYNGTMRTVWEGLGVVDYGHGALPPIVNCQSAAELDEHANVFAGYSNLLQWALSEITCTGFGPGGVGEIRQIGGYSKKWKKEVLARFDDRLTHLVDSSVLNFHIPTPNAIHNANPARVRHATISLAAASLYTANANGIGKPRIQLVLASCSRLRGAFEGLIGRFEGNTKSLNPANNTWV